MKPIKGNIQLKKINSSKILKKPPLVPNNNKSKANNRIMNCQIPINITKDLNDKKNIIPQE